MFNDCSGCHLLICMAYGILRAISADAPPSIHIVQLTIGDATTNLGYNLMGPAYDIALNNAAHQYPDVFANMTVTRYFVPGEGLSCAESTGMVTEGLFTLLPDSRQESHGEFTIVLSPGCTFEVMTLGDFAREADVPILASSASVPNPHRYPTLLALSATSYSTIARAVAEFLKRFSWLTFNLLCDKNQDPIQIQAIEVICALILNYIQTQARELNAVTNYFDSSKPGTYKAVVMESRKYSTINVLASYPSSYKLLLTEASLAGMSTGEYVFIVLPLSPFLTLEDSITDVSSPTSEPLLRILPFVFHLETDEINWNAVSNDTNAMDELALYAYNWTVIPEREHNVLRLAAYESVQVMTEILTENYHNLHNMSAQAFALKFANRSFDLPSRKVKLSGSGSRLCDITIKQFQGITRAYKTVFVFDNMRLSLDPVTDRPGILWPDHVNFPPSFPPICYTSSGARCYSNQTDSTTVPVAVCCILLIFIAVVVVFRWKGLQGDSTWWILTDHSVIYRYTASRSPPSPEVIYRQQKQLTHESRAALGHGI